jgi:mevalonate pyrophosphate decarboxylase
VLEAQAGHLSKRMSDHYKHISEKAARKASDELARVRTGQRAEARAKLREGSRANTADGLIDSAATPVTLDAAIAAQPVVVH